MIQLRTLGALELRRTDGTELHAVLAQPKRLALLAYLAVATPQGYHRRDTLLGLFWPELDQAHARNALSRAIYFIRRALGEASIVGRGDEELQLATELVQCDAREFEAALHAGRLDEALALYRGDLMEGFFLSGAPQFERWLEDRRAVLRAKAAEGARALALHAEREGRTAEAEQWARRALALSPYDEGALAELIRVLERRGDRAQALVTYDLFARRLSADLGVEPSSRTKALVDSWRRETGRVQHAAAHGPIPSELASTPAHLDLPAPPRPRFKWISRRRGVVAVAVVAACVWIVEATPPAFSSLGHEAAIPTTTTIAVLPFSVHAPESAYGFLREGMVDLISTKLNSAVGLHSVDPTVLLSTPALRPPTTIGPAAGRIVGKRLGASYFVLGSVVAIADSVQLAAALYDVDGSSLPVAKATVTGTVGNLFLLVDGLAADLVGKIGTPSERLDRVASITTQSHGALRAYLDAERAYREASFAPAVRLTDAINAFREAVRLDSTFALAYYRLGAVAGWADSLPLARWASARAQRYGARLPEHYRLLSEARDADLAGDAKRAMLLYRAAVARHPEDAEAWLYLGSVTALYGPILGASLSDLRQLFANAVRHNPRNVEPRIYLAHLAMLANDPVATDSLIRKAYPDGVPAFWELLVALGRTDTARASRARARLDGAEAWEQSYSALLVTRYLNDPALGRQIGSRSKALARGSLWHSEAQLWLAQVELAAGRPAAARQLFSGLATLDPRRGAEFQALLAAWPLSPQSRLQLEAARRPLLEAQRLPVLAHPFGTRPVPHAAEPTRLYLLGVISARLGERDRALEYARRLDATAPSEAIGSLSTDLAICLRAEIRAVLEGMRDEALTLLRDARYQIPPDVLKAQHVLFQVFARIRYLQGEWSSAVGRPADALRWYASLGGVDHPLDLPLWAPAQLATARIHEQRGALDDARAEYARFVALWRDAEPELQPLLSEARAGLARLGP